MTTKVKITNDSGSAVDGNHVVKITNRGGGEVATLKPGESYENHVHSDESFTVSEASAAQGGQ